MYHQETFVLVECFVVILAFALVVANANYSKRKIKGSRSGIIMIAIITKIRFNSHSGNRQQSRTCPSYYQGHDSDGTVTFINPQAVYGRSNRPLTLFCGVCGRENWPLA